MEKKGHLYEIIIKSIFLVVGIIGLILIFSNLIHILPLLNSFSLDYNQMHLYIIDTELAPAYKALTSVDYLNGSVIVKVLLSFVINLPIFSLLFLLLTLVMGIIYFLFVKWPLIRSYFKLSLVHIGLFIVKYVLFGLLLLAFYSSDMKSLAVGLFIGTITYILISLVQIFFHSLWVLKFIFNISDDIKEYNNC